MMLFIRAEREGEFPLHLYACQQMIPYFFAAGHINYARYGVCYLMTMSKLPPTLLDQFLRAEHVLRHQHGIWNEIWSDMMIETSYMKFGKGPSGIICKTTKPKTPESIHCNIYTGQTLEKKVNVNKAVEIGEKQMASFHSSQPDIFGPQ